MKKRKGFLKKILGTFAALAMTVGVVSGSAVPVQAENNGSITISNSETGRTYNVYKIFDATYDNEGHVSYTYTPKTSVTSDALLQALQGEEGSKLFTLNKVGDSYNIIWKKGQADASEEEVLSFFRKYGPMYNGESKTWSGGDYGSAVTTATGNGGQLVIDNLAYGYYFVTTNSGSIASINTAAKDVTIIDKNQSIVIPDKQESVDGGTNWQYQETTDETNIPTASVGDTVNYKVVNSFTNYYGTTPVKNLVFTDTMSDGLTADQNVVVKINGTQLTTYNQKKNGETTTKVGSGDNIQYSVVYKKNNDNTWTTIITIPTANLDTNGNVSSYIYTNASNSYEITYTAKVNKDAIAVDPETNTIDLKYNDNHDIGSDTTKVANYDLTLKKYDGKNTEVKTDDTALPGAKFKLYSENGNIPIKVILMTGSQYGDGSKDGGSTSPVVSNTYRVAEDNEAGAVEEMTAGKNGMIVVKGLKNGSYQFEETHAPDGFNRLTTRTDVATITNANASIDVINNAGPTLPSTGGIGTKVFYIAGGILIIGAAVLLINRKKKANA